MIGIERFILRDDQWERVKHLLPGKETDRGVTAKDNRLFLEAVLWIARTGAPWRDLPRYFGNWNSVYVRFSRWAKKGSGSAFLRPTVPILIWRRCWWIAPRYALTNTPLAPKKSPPPG